MGAILGRDERVLVGPETSDDAGVFAYRGSALVATADFITPVCDDPFRYGRVAAANSVSDVFAMGGRVLFGLNLCCFPESEAPKEVFSQILAGAAAVLRECGAALLGGHSVRDEELKFGLAVIGEADPARLLTNAGARPGQRLVLTKPLGSGVVLNAFKAGKIDEAALEPTLAGMERLNSKASELALAHGATGATDITGFGFAGHTLEMARASGVHLQVRFGALPVYPGFYELAKKGVTTGCTDHNKANAWDLFRNSAALGRYEQELIFDPQTSGGLLVALPAEESAAFVAELLASGHQAAEIGEVLAGHPLLELV